MVEEDGQEEEESVTSWRVRVYVNPRRVENGKKETVSGGESRAAPPLGESVIAYGPEHCQDSPGNGSPRSW